MDKSLQNLEHHLVEYVLGLCSIEEIEKAAGDALEAGIDSPHLRQLASARAFEKSQLASLIPRAASEVGLEVPTLDCAGLSLSKRIAQGIVDGSIEPYSGARRIWNDIYVKLPHLKVLIPFVGLASEYEDAPQFKDEYIDDIKKASQKFLLEMT